MWDGPEASIVTTNCHSTTQSVDAQNRGRESEAAPSLPPHRSSAQAFKMAELLQLSILNQTS